MTVVAIKAPVITKSCFLPTLTVTSSIFVATTNTLGTWHDEYNMSLWWCCVPVILFVDGHQKVRSNFLRDNCSHVLVSVPGIKLITSFLYQYNPKYSTKGYKRKSIEVNILEREASHQRSKYLKFKNLNKSFAMKKTRK